MKILLVFSTLFLLVSCKNITGDELVKEYVMDSAFIEKREIFDFEVVLRDSFYSKASLDPSYQHYYTECLNNVVSAAAELSNCKREMAQWWVDKNSYPISFPRIDMYMDFFRKDFSTLKKMLASYKPKYLGFMYHFRAKYKTQFADSVLMGYCLLSPNESKILDSRIYTGLASDDNSVDSHKFLLPGPKNTDAEELEKLAEDTLNIEVPEEWRKAYIKAHPEYSITKM